MRRHRSIAALLSVVLAGGMLVAGGAPTLAAKDYKNCTALNKAYPHGVGKPHAHDHVSSGYPVTNFYRSRSLYTANKGKDRDGDGIACEKH